MISTYKIPLKSKEGKYKFSELNIDEGAERLLLDYDTEYQMIIYNVPVYENEARLYMVPRELMPDGLAAVYGTGGSLERIELAQEDGTRLIYIRFENNEAAKKEVLRYAKAQADSMCAELIGRKQKLARLFFGKFYDGQAVEIAVKFAAEQEMKAVIDKYDGKLSAADNSGNYPFENAMMLDYKPFGVMLMCTSHDFRGTLFELAAETIEKQIRGCVLGKIEKTADFKYIAEEWD